MKVVLAEVLNAVNKALDKYGLVIGGYEVKDVYTDLVMIEQPGNVVEFDVMEDPEGGGYCRECSNTTCPSWSKAQEYARKEKKFRKSNKN